MEPNTTQSIGDRLMAQRILVLGEEVTDHSANRLISQLLVLSADDPRSDICRYLNSPGGSVLSGLAIYDTMQLIPNDVATVAMGFAASMAQVLLCAGAAGKRFALPNAQIVMHEGSAGLADSASDVEIQAKNLRDTLDRMRRIIAHHTGRSIDEITHDVGRDRWFDADEAVDYGFVDRVVESLEEILPAGAERRVGFVGARA